MEVVERRSMTVSKLYDMGPSAIVQKYTTEGLIKTKNSPDFQAAFPKRRRDS
jgi:hypothetical protein